MNAKFPSYGAFSQYKQYTAVACIEVPHKKAFFIICISA